MALEQINQKLSLETQTFELLGKMQPKEGFVFRVYKVFLQGNDTPNSFAEACIMKEPSKTQELSYPDFLNELKFMKNNLYMGSPKVYLRLERISEKKIQSSPSASAFSQAENDTTVFFEGLFS